MGRKLYAQSEGGIQFISQRRPGDVRIPNYVYDIWLPLLGAKALGVYALYCRLEREGAVKSISQDRIAKLCRMGTDTLAKINADLVDCGFIRIRNPQGHERLMHWSAEYTILDPPREATKEQIDNYAPPSGYEPVSTWLVQVEGSTPPNRDAKGAPEQGQSAPLNRDAKVETLEVGTSEFAPSVITSSANAEKPSDPSTSATNSDQYDPNASTTPDPDSLVVGSDQEDRSGSDQDTTKGLSPVDPIKRACASIPYRCKSCNEVIDLYGIDRSRPECPHCGAGLPIRHNADRPDKRKKKKKRKSSAAEWLPAVRAFCDRVPSLNYDVMERSRFPWAIKIRDDAVDASVEDVVAAIERIDYWPDWLDTPYNPVFGRNLREALDKGEEVWWTTKDCTIT